MIARFEISQFLGLLKYEHSEVLHETDESLAPNVGTTAKACLLAKLGCNFRV